MVHVNNNVTRRTKRRERTAPKEEAAGPVPEKDLRADVLLCATVLRLRRALGRRGES